MDSILFYFSHTLVFERGDLLEPNVVTMSEYRNASAAVADVADLADEGQLLNIPSNIASSYISVEPHDQFASVADTAEISIVLNDANITAEVKLRRANRISAYAFTELDTQIVDGRAVAQTNQGGIFVAGFSENSMTTVSPSENSMTTSDNLVTALVVVGVVLLLVSMMVVATVLYFVVQPGKWKSAKTKMKKAQRSFSRKV